MLFIAQRETHTYFPKYTHMVNATTVLLFTRPLLVLSLFCKHPTPVFICLCDDLGNYFYIFKKSFVMYMQEISRRLLIDEKATLKIVNVFILVTRA